jgi:TetR/AcrR family fatty acid metabolism transcriptional regulator
MVPHSPASLASRSVRKDRTRARILEAARRAFASRGYHGTLMDHVAREAGVSKGATLVERVTGAISGAQGGRAKVSAALHAALGVFEENEPLTRLFLLESAGVSPEVERRRWELRAALAGLVQAYLDEAVSDGDIPPQDTALAATAWLGAVSEVVVRWLYEPAKPLRASVPQLAALLLRSVGFPEEG